METMDTVLIKNSRGRKILEFDGNFWIVYPEFVSKYDDPDSCLRINANAVEKNVYGLVNLLLKQGHDPDQMLDLVCSRSLHWRTIINEYRRNLKQLKERAVLHENTNSSMISEWTDYLYLYHDLKIGFTLEFSIFCQDVLDDLDEDSDLNDHNLLGETVYYTVKGIESYEELKEELICANKQIVRTAWEIPDIDPLIEEYERAEVKENLVKKLRHYLNEIRNLNVHPNQLNIEFPNFYYIDR